MFIVTVKDDEKNSCNENNIKCIMDIFRHFQKFTEGQTPKSAFTL